jgi:hypothetical protein
MLLTNSWFLSGTGRKPPLINVAGAAESQFLIYYLDTTWAVAAY